MVVAFSSATFTRNELLVGRLVGFGGAPTTRSSRESSLVSSTGEYYIGSILVLGAK